ncbi:hypothetical protein M0802_006191 [Mischocyttarus mexicanus]|nr:hypothetical protein M0802_006191 [Mischocyttarus mexicanus]
MLVPLAYIIQYFFRLNVGPFSPVSLTTCSSTFKRTLRWYRECWMGIQSIVPRLIAIVDLALNTMSPSRSRRRVTRRLHDYDYDNDDDYDYDDDDAF